MRGILRQGVGNATGLLWQPTERLGAAVLAQPERLVRQARGQSTADLPQLGEAARMAGSMLWNVPGAAAEAGRSVLSGQGAQRARQAMGAPQAPRGVIDHINEAGYRAFGLFDTFARRLAEQGERAALQYRGGLAPDEVKAKAEAAGDYRVLTQDMDRIGEKMDALRKTVPGGKYVVPYWEVPYNGLKYDLERSPLGLGKTAFQTIANRGRGGVDPTEFYERWTRGIAGTGLAVALFHAAMNGWLTGPEPQDQTEKDAWRAEGKQPFSFRVGDRWVPITATQGLQGAVTQAASVADFVRRENLRGGKWDADAYARLVNRAVTSTIAGMISRPFFDGLYNVIKQINEGKESGDLSGGAAGVAQNVAQGFVVPGVVRDVEQATSDVNRAPRNTAERVMAGVPGLSGFVPERRDVFGRRDTRPSDIVDVPGVGRVNLGGLERFASPIRTTTARPGQRRFAASASAEQDTAIQQALTASKAEQQSLAKGIPLPPADRPTPRQRTLASIHAAADTEAPNILWTERRRLERERLARVKAQPSAVARLLQTAGIGGSGRK